MVTKKFPGFSFWSWLIGTIIVVVGAAVTITVWAMTEHSDLKDFTIQQDNAIHDKVMREADEKFVPKRDFSRIEERIEGQGRTLEKQDKNLERIEEKIDRIFNNLNRGPNRSRSN